MNRFDYHRIIRIDGSHTGTKMMGNLSLGFTLLLFTSTVILMVSPLLFAKDTASIPVQKPKKEFLNFYADKLVVDNVKNTAEFSGNVKGTLENMVITAQQINIFFLNSLSGENKLKVNEDSIKKIVASENVIITFDNRIAQADQAVYNTKQRILVLSGGQVKVTMGEDSVTGSRITFYRTDERIIVEGGRDTRVNAIFHSGNKELE